MPEVVMSHVTQTSARSSDIKGHIDYLRQSMDQVASCLDGFSDSDSSANDDGEDSSDLGQSMSRSSGGENRRHVCKKESHLKNGVVARRKTIRLSRLKSADDQSSVQSSKDIPHVKRSISETKNNKDNHENDNDSKNSETFDPTIYQTLRPGQDEAEADIPIMSPPPVENTPKYEPCKSASSRYSRPLSLLLLMTHGDPVKCDFRAAQYEGVTKSLLNVSDKKKSDCICISNSSQESLFGGWVVTQKSVNSKYKNNNKRRKSSKPQNSDVAFDRLTGAGNYEKFPTQFQHFKNTSHYIEAYRILNTVDNVGRSHTTITPAYVKKPPDTTADPYFNKMKTTVCAMASTCDLYSLLAVPRRETNSTVSDTESVVEKSRSDEESYEDSVYDSRGYTVKDRGKILNLAPVRECTVPGLTFKERQEHYQQNYVALNQYLNLMTPPVPPRGLQFEIDEARMRRNGFRIVNAGDNNLFPACTPRRGARPLRLGSAEFLKPNPCPAETRWTLEKRHSAGATPNPNSTLPGTIIVGSTVMPHTSSYVHTRARNSGKLLPYVQFQREQLLAREQIQTREQQLQTREQHLQTRNIEKPHTPPQHISGTKFRQYERMTDLTSPSNEKTRLSYTQAPSTEKQLLQYRSATVVDWDDKTKYAKREKAAVKLDVNHLGIRGHTFKPDEQITIYKHRRTASLKS